MLLQISMDKVTEKKCFKHLYFPDMTLFKVWLIFLSVLGNFPPRKFY